MKNLNNRQYQNNVTNIDDSPVAYQNIRVLKPSGIQALLDLIAAQGIEAVLANKGETNTFYDLKGSPQVKTVIRLGNGHNKALDGLVEAWQGNTDRLVICIGQLKSSEPEVVEDDEAY